MTNNPIRQMPDHIGGNFEWEFAPSCCDLLKDAVDAEKFIFVGNFTENKWNSCYMMPLSSDGELVRSDGIAISYCPWCGEKITVRKKYSVSE